MHQDSFRSVVCRSLSKSLPSRSKDGCYPERAQRADPCVVTLQPTVCRGCQSLDWSPTKSSREERSILLAQKDYLMSSSLSKHFAEDLLRGAMDLQESLVMLEKFQTVSRSMRHSNKKSGPATGEKSSELTRIHEALLEASGAKKVAPGGISNGLGGQPRNSTNGLKKVISDSLHRNNLLSVSSNDEQASLSQSSRYKPNSSVISKSIKQNKVLPRSLSCAPVQPDKSNSPSLVAKLMGLDGFPTLKANTVKKEETLRTVSSPRARFDIEMPKSRMLPAQLYGEDCRIDIEKPMLEKLQPQLLGEKYDFKGKAGQEFMDTTQFKRFSKTIKADEHKNQRHNVRMYIPYSQKDILPSYAISGVHKLGSIKSIQREKGIERGRTKVPEDSKFVSEGTKEATENSRKNKDKQKSHLSDRKREGRKDIKAKTTSASRTNAKPVKRPDKKLGASSSSPSTIHTTKPLLRKAPSNSRKKIVPSRNVKNSAIDGIAEYEVYREFIQSDGPSTEHSATPSDESCQSADWDTETCMDDTQGDFSGYEASLCTSPVKIINSTDRDAFHLAIDRTSPKEAEITDEMSLLLLSDKSFLTRAAQLAGIGAYEHLVEKYKCIPKAQTKNLKLYVDAATEQLERLQQNSQKCRATTYFSLEALLSDISNGIRKLESYTGDDDGCGTQDTLYTKLEGDLKCSDTSINSAWDMGWHDWICMEETDSCVGDVGESILSLLIEEAALGMLVN